MSIPITIISGYLGAGKTTLINRLLASSVAVGNVAILVNDFGAVNIDEQLIRNQSEQQPDRIPGQQIIGLANGCVCCSIGDDFSRQLMALPQLGIQQVVLEASGVALPEKLRRQCRLPGFHPRGCFVLVDGHNHRQRLGDKYVGHLVACQVTQADELVVSKISGPVNKQALQLPADSRPWLADDPALLVQLLDNATLSAAAAPAICSDTAIPDMQQIVIHPIAGVSADQVRDFLSNLPPFVQRVKGFVQSGAGPLLVQWVPPDGGPDAVTPLSGTATSSGSSMRSELVLLCPAGAFASLERHLHSVAQEFHKG